MDALSATLMSQGFLKAPLDPHNAQQSLQDLSKACQSFLAHAQLASTRQTTLQYDLERATKEADKFKLVAAQAEREKEHWKADKQTAIADLTTERKCHTQTKEEFSKTKVALQYVKTVAETERKRKEREMSDMVAKLVPASAGLNSRARIQQAIPNAARGVDGEKDLLEDALRDLEEVRQALLGENEKFRGAFAEAIHQQTQAIRELGIEPASLASVVADADLHPEPHLTLPPEDLSLFASSLTRQLQDHLDGMQQQCQEARQEVEDVRCTLAREHAAREASNSSLKNQIKELEMEITSSRERIAELQQQLSEKRDDEAATRKEEERHLKKERKALNKTLASMEEREAKLQAQEEQLQFEQRAWAEAQREARSKPPPAAVEYEKVVPESISSAPKVYEKAKKKSATPVKPVPPPKQPPTTSRIARNLAQVLFDSPGAPVASAPIKSTKAVLQPVLVNQASQRSASQASKIGKSAAKKPMEPSQEGRQVSSGKARFQAALAKVEGRG